MEINCGDPCCVGVSLGRIVNVDSNIDRPYLDCMIRPDVHGHVSIPDTVTFIPYEAFRGCFPPVGSIDIADSVTNIGVMAFLGSQLEYVDVPDSVTSIGTGAFAFSFALLSVSMSNSMTSIASYLFYFCNSLVAINIPDSVTTIEHEAFMMSVDFFPFVLLEINMSNSVTLIGEHAFDGCVHLISIELPDSLVVIEDYAFHGSSLVTVIIPDSVSSIESWAFGSCGLLQSINMSDSVQFIGEYAFASTKLRSVKLPPNVTLTGTSFVGTFLCGGQVNGVANADDDDGGALPTQRRFRVDLPVLSSYVFYQCVILETLNITDSVQVIQSYAVSSCVNLNNVSIPDSVRYIATSAFLGSSGLTTIRIPPTVNVSSGAFFGCGCSDNVYGNGTALQDCVPGYIDVPTDEWIALTVCDFTSTYESVQNTYTSDRVCSPLTFCTDGIAVPETTSTDRVCHLTNPPMTKGDEAAIIVVVFLALLVMAATFYRLNRMRKSAVVDLELNEKLLQEEQMQKATLYAENIEMKRAWEILEDDLVLEHELASGGFGSVWKAKWGHIDVAVKILRTTIEGDGEGFASDEFNREVSFMQKIRHPNLLTFYGAGVTKDSRAFMVVELMRFGSMRQMLRSSRPLTCESRVLMALDIARGMSHLHSLECIHRDLKSDNCLVGDELRVKVGDFGTSRLMRSQGSSISVHNFTNVGTAPTLTGSVGTPLWMAPELMGSIDPRHYGKEVDVYSFGIVLWELMMRLTPWEEEVTAKGIRFFEALQKAVLGGVRPRLPPSTDFSQEYVLLMQQCWQTDPAGRPTFAQASVELAQM